MEVKDQPNQTDPSVVASITDNPIQDRIASVIAENKANEDSLISTVKAEAAVGGNGSEVSSPKDSPVTDPNAEVLSLVSGILGREFKSVEEVKSTLSNLNSLVGDQAVAKVRQDAKLYDTFVNKFAGEKGITVDEAKKFWAETLVQPSVVQPKPQSQPVAQTKTETKMDDSLIKELSADIEALKVQAQRSELLNKYPFAGEVADELAIIANRKGVTQLEAFEQSPLKPLLEQKVKDESAKSPVVTPSSRIGFDRNRVQELGSKVLQTNNESDKVALVNEFKEVLGL